MQVYVDIQVLSLLFEQTHERIIYQYSFHCVISLDSESICGQYAVLKILRARNCERSPKVKVGPGDRYCAKLSCTGRRPGRTHHSTNKTLKAEDTSCVKTEHGEASRAGGVIRRTGHIDIRKSDRLRWVGQVNMNHNMNQEKILLERYVRYSPTEVRTGVHSV